MPKRQQTLQVAQRPKLFSFEGKKKTFKLKISPKEKHGSERRALVAHKPWPKLQTLLVPYLAHFALGPQQKNLETFFL